MPFEFQSGTEGAKAMQKAAGGGGGRAVDYFKLGDGESAFVRFITDYNPSFPDEDEGHVFVMGVINVLEHAVVPTGPKPSDLPKDAKWPGTMSAVCRYTPVGPADDTHPAFDDCYVCDNVTTKEGRPWKKSARTYGLAVLREEIRKEGKVIGYKDKTVEVAKRDKDGKETGETEERPAYVQISQGYKNFWSGFVGSYDMYGTLLDRDYKITRSGSGPTDTEYLVAAANPMAVKDDDGNKVIMDLRVGWIRDKFYPNAPDLGEIVEGKMNDEFFSHFFLGGSTSDSGDESTEASSNDATESDLAAMADRIKPLGNTNESSDDDEDLMMVAD